MNLKKTNKLLFLFPLFLILLLQQACIISYERNEICSEIGDLEDLLVEMPQSSESVLWTKNGNAVCVLTGSQALPKIISDGSGGVIITWKDFRVSGSNIYAQRINSTGAIQWVLNGVAICTATGTQDNPEIISDGFGGAIITWEDERSGDKDIYAQRVNSTGAIQWMLNGVAICKAQNSQDDPQIISNGSGGAIIAWYDYRSGGYDIYAQSINSAGTTLWQANGTVICNATYNQWNPEIESDGSGGAIIAWIDSRSGIGFNDIYAQSINSAGTTLWQANGTAICNATDGQMYPALISDGFGGAIITWEDERSGFNDIYAQSINSAGTSLWQANGTVICNATGAQTNPKLISDGSGGAIIAWIDGRSGNNDIYAQSINSAGTTLWQANGTVVCNPTGSQLNQELVNDIQGGAIITWQDLRSGVNDIYAQRISPYDVPEVNHPIDIATTTTGSETINWSLTDDFSIGQYRILANDTHGNYYIWIDWNQWDNNTNLEVSINRTVSGVFNYTLEYYDGQGAFGIPDTVIVTITHQAPPPVSDDDDGDDDEDDDNDNTDSSSIPGFHLTIIGLISGLAIISIAKTLIRKKIMLRN